MMVPVVYTLALRYPHVRITVLSRPFARPFFEDLAPNVNFMSADVKKDYRGVKGLNRLYRRLVAKQPTAIADLHAVLRSDYLRMRFNLGHFKVQHLNKHRHDRRHLVAKGKKRVVKQLNSPFKNYADVFERLGYPVGELLFKSVFQHAQDGQEAIDPAVKPTGNLNMLPREVGPKRSWEQWIGIAPFAAHEGKIYPPERTFQVVEQLARHYPKARFFLFGRGENEENTFKEWTAKIPQCLSVTQYMENMHQELILMSHLDVMLSMDSANMHMASLTATPVVSVWGATHPMAGFMGYGQSLENVVQIDLPCRPCSIYGEKPCYRNDYQCLNGIEPERIVEKIIKVIGQ